MTWIELTLISILLLLAAGLAFWAHLRFWERRLGIELSYALIESIQTPDGSTIELRRLPAPDAALDLPPVLLVHGLAANHRNIDFLADVSLARHLSARGHDVWLLTLRSGVRRKSLSETRRIRFALMVEHDLPLAVNEVLTRSGASSIDYIGFSMGGMLLYAALGHTLSPERIRRVAIIGSPAIIRPPVAFPVPAIVARFPAFFFPTLRLRLAARAGAFASEWLKTPAHHWVFNPANVAPGVARHALFNVIEDVAGPLNRDFAAFAATADGVLTHGGVKVLERLTHVQSPAIFFAGGADRLAPERSVRAAFDAWGAKTAHPNKRFVLLSVAAGASADYGHGDLAVGVRVREEIFEPLAAFLEEDSPVTVEPGERK